MKETMTEIIKETMMEIIPVFVCFDQSPADQFAAQVVSVVWKL